MEPNPYESPKEANETKPTRRPINETKGIVRFISLFIIGVVIAMVLASLWMASAAWG